MNDFEEDGSWCTTSFEEDVYKVETNQQIRVIHSKTTTHFNNNNQSVNSPSNNETNEIITVRNISSSRLLTRRVSSECTSIQNAKRMNALKSITRESNRPSIKIHNQSKINKNSERIHEQRWSSPIGNRNSENFPKQLLFPNRSASSSLKEDEKKLQFVKNMKQYCLDLVGKDKTNTNDKNSIKTHYVQTNSCRFVDEKISKHHPKDISQTSWSQCLKNSKDTSSPDSLCENSSRNTIIVQQTYEQLLQSLKSAQANVLQKIVQKWKNDPTTKENTEDEIAKIIPNLQLPETSSSSINSEKEIENYESSGRGNSVDFITLNNIHNQTVPINTAEHSTRKNYEFSAQHAPRSIQNDSPNHNSKTARMEQSQKEIEQFTLLPTNQQLKKLEFCKMKYRKLKSQIEKKTHLPEIDNDLVQELKENNALLSKVIIEQQALRESEGNLYSNLLNTMAKNLKCSDSSTHPTVRSVPINEQNAQSSLSIQSLQMNRNKNTQSYSKLSNFPKTNFQKFHGSKSELKAKNLLNLHDPSFKNNEKGTSSQNYHGSGNFSSLNKKHSVRYVIKKPKSQFSNQVHFNSLNATRSSSYENSDMVYKPNRKPVRKLKRKKNTTDIPSNESLKLFKLRQNYRRRDLSENNEILPQWMISYALSNSKHSLYLSNSKNRNNETTSIATQTVLSPNKYTTKAKVLSNNTSLNSEHMSPDNLLIEKIVYDISKLNNQALLFRIQELENEKRYIEKQFQASLQREKNLNEKLDDLFQLNHNLKEPPDVQSSERKEKTYSNSTTAKSSNENNQKQKTKFRKSGTNAGLKIEIRQLKQRIFKLKKECNKSKQQRYHPIKYEHHSGEQYKPIPYFNKYPSTNNDFGTTEPQNMQCILSPSSQQYDNRILLENRNIEHHNIIKQSNSILNDNKPNKEVSNTKIHELNTRLKQTTQQVIDQCKLIKELKKNLKEQNNVIDNLKFRLSRSESVCHNKQLLLEAYKSKLTNAISTNELNQSLKSQASRQCNIITNEMKVLGDSLAAMKLREGELMKLVNRLEKDKNRLTEEINRKNSFKMENLQKQITKAINEKQEEITRQIQVNTQLNDLNNLSNERLKKYEIGIEEFLWMVDDYLYQKYGENDPVRKAHEMACSILHLTPTELREMFQDCDIDYNTKSPRMLDNWMTEYKKIISGYDDDFSQKLAQFLYKICFSNINSNNEKPN